MTVSRGPTADVRPGQIRRSWFYVPSPKERAMSHGKAVREELRVPTRELRHASPAEAAEAIGVTFVMNGGPATVYGARAFAAFQEFYQELAVEPGQQRRGV
jgi:hypothetical protein